jgi:hypothetical protein
MCHSVRLCRLRKQSAGPSYFYFKLFRGPLFPCAFSRMNLRIAARSRSDHRRTCTSAPLPIFTTGVTPTSSAPPSGTTRRTLNVLFVQNASPRMFLPQWGNPAKVVALHIVYAWCVAMALKLAIDGRFLITSFCPTLIGRGR